MIDLFALMEEAWKVTAGLLAALIIAIIIIWWRSGK